MEEHQGLHWTDEVRIKLKENNVGNCGLSEYLVSHWDCKTRKNGRAFFPVREKSGNMIQNTVQ